jgi:hypothetical protein
MNLNVFFKYIHSSLNTGNMLLWSHIASERKSHRSHNIRPSEHFIRVQQATRHGYISLISANQNKKHQMSPV